MTAPVQIRIDQVAVEIPAELPAREVEAAVRDALELLAARLARAPLPRVGATPAQDLARIEVGPLAPGWTPGPGGAEQLADALYRRIAAVV